MLILGEKYKFTKLDEDNLIKKLKAYKQRRIYGILPYNNYMTNIGTAFSDTYYIGKVLAPNKFNDIDIVKKLMKFISF